MSKEHQQRRAGPLNDLTTPALALMHLPVQACSQSVESMAFAGRRVLVVEDEFLVSLATTDLLEGVGCIIVGPAVRVAAALQLAQSKSLDAAVLDIDLAGEMIWPVVEELQRRGVPILLLSAYAPQGMIPARFAAIPRLDKPLEDDRLLDRLGGMWGRSREQHPISRTGLSPGT